MSGYAKDRSADCRYCYYWSRNGAQPQNTSAIHKGFGDMPQQAKWEVSAVRSSLPIFASV